MTSLHYSHDNQSPNQPPPGKWLSLVLSPLHCALLTLPDSIQFSSIHLQIQDDWLGTQPNLGWVIRLSLQKYSTSRVLEATERQQTCLLQASGPGAIHFPLTNAINTKLLFVHTWLQGQEIGEKKKRKKRKRTTNRCISFPGASFTRTPFSTGFPSFPDGLLASEGEKNKVKKKIWKWYDTVVELQ